MQVNKNKIEKFEKLRQQAEELIQHQPNKISEKPDDILELINELRVYQAELEIQNEELQNAQQEISALHYKYQNLYEFAPCGYLTLNAQGIITQANLMAVKLLRIDRLYLLKSGFTQFIKEGWDNKYLLARKKAGEIGEKQSLELPLKCEKDQELWIQADIEAYQDENKHLTQYRMTIIDITLQKQTKEAYRQKAIEMEALYNCTKILLDEKNFEITSRKIINICKETTGAKAGYVALLNNNAEENKLVFFDFDSLSCDINSNFSMPIRGLSEEAYKFGKTVFDNDFSNSKWMHHMPENHVKLKNILFGPLVDNGDTIGLIGLANKEGNFNKNDARIVGRISELATVALKQSYTRQELQESQQQLIQSQKMEAIGTLAGGISHDFNNMLSIIKGNVEYVLIRMQKDSNLTECLENAQMAINKAAVMIRQLVTFSRGGKPIKDVLNLNELIKETVYLVLRGSACICDLSLDDEILPVEADKSQIGQSLTNLLINAIQAMPEGGTIQIKTEKVFVNADKQFLLPGQPYVSIKISDQGTGIPEKHLTKIFDPFFTTKKKGSGIGLATTFSIIKNHDGHIRVESSVGKGTIFTIYLPSTEKEISLFENKDEISHKGKGKILVMDDLKELAKVTKLMLDQMGYNTIIVNDGAQAIEKYSESYKSQNPFDAVILDLTVPGGMGGAKTIPELLKIDPNVKAIACSAYFDTPIMANYEKYGFCGVLPKPYAMPQLTDVLKKVLEKNE